MNKKLLHCPYCKAEPIFIDNYFTNNENCEYLYTIRCSKGCDVSVSCNSEHGISDFWNDFIEEIKKEGSKYG